MRHCESINASLQLESKLLLAYTCIYKVQLQKKRKEFVWRQYTAKDILFRSCRLWHGLISRKTCMFHESRPASMFLHLALRTNSFRARVTLHSATKFNLYSFLLSSLLFFMKYKSIDYIIIITDTMIAISTIRHIYRYYDRMTRNIYTYIYIYIICMPT